MKKKTISSESEFHASRNVIVTAASSAQINCAHTQWEINKEIISIFKFCFYFVRSEHGLHWKIPISIPMFMFRWNTILLYYSPRIIERCVFVFLYAANDRRWQQQHMLCTVYTQTNTQLKRIKPKQNKNIQITLATFDLNQMVSFLALSTEQHLHWAMDYLKPNRFHAARNMLRLLLIHNCFFSPLKFIVHLHQ